MIFSNEQMERYSRHIILREIGVKGQERLLKGRVLVIGAGGGVIGRASRLRRRSSTSRAICLPARF
ncbi:MAG: hypothetical protein LBS45_01915 [Synergistaceae bacterium]|nr:hypothetical protein [Synergistaceae bacterium]